MSEETLRLGTTNRRLDAVAVEQGREFPCPLRPGLTITILPAAEFNPRYVRAIRKSTEAVRDLLSEAKDQDKEAKKILEKGAREESILGELSTAEFLVEAIVTDIKGLFNHETGEELEYTPERGLRILSDPGHADVKNWIAMQATRFGHFYVKQTEKDLGNSSRGSRGKKSGAARAGKTKR